MFNVTTEKSSVDKLTNGESFAIRIPKKGNLSDSDLSVFFVFMNERLTPHEDLGNCEYDEKGC